MFHGKALRNEMSLKYSFDIYQKTILEELVAIGASRQCSTRERLIFFVILNIGDEHQRKVGQQAEPPASLLSK